MEKELGRISKNQTTEIVIRIDDFGGKRGLTIREFVTSDKYTGFTKSGVRIPTEDFSKFKEMINSVNEKELNEPVSTEKTEKSSPKKSKPTEELDDY